MFVIFSQVLILLIFVTIGFVLGKGNVVKTEHTKILSSLLVYVFLSCNIYKTFSARFSLEYIAANYKLLLISAAVVCVLLVAAHFMAKLFSKNKYERCIYEYSLVIPNYGYIGYALAEALFGQAGLINFMTFAVPVSLYTYTFGFAKLTKQGASLKKLCNPVIISMALGIAAGLSGFTLPDVLADVIDKASGCMAPVSMLLTGIVISGFSLKSMLSNVKSYGLVMLRLVVIPLLLGTVLYWFCEEHVAQTAILFYALPCGLNTVVFPRLVDENCQIGAGLALISTVLTCITLPIVLTIFHIG